MKTLEELKEYYNSTKEQLCHEAVSAVVLQFLDYKEAVRLDPELIIILNITPKQWKEYQVSFTKDSVKEQMKDAVESGWEWILDHQSWNCYRVVQAVKTYLWILEDDELYNYSKTLKIPFSYGAPLLAKVSEKYGFPLPRNAQLQNMIQGKPCSPFCTMCLDE